jgi:hypothetical protein
MKYMIALIFMIIVAANISYAADSLRLSKSEERIKTSALENHFCDTKFTSPIITHMKRCVSCKDIKKPQSNRNREQVDCAQQLARLALTVVNDPQEPEEVRTPLREAIEDVTNYAMRLESLITPY